MIMGMNAPQIAHRGDPAGAPVSRTPAAEHLAHMAVIAEMYAAERGLANMIMGMNAP